MTEQDVINIINTYLHDNTARDISPKKVRDVFEVVKDWLNNNKVEKINGKGLSTHDLTNELLDKILHGENTWETENWL